MINVEVAFALPNQQRIISLQVEEGTTAYEAVVQSNIATIFPQIDPEKAPMGIFSRAVKKPRDEVLREGDRVEIYRPLQIDPKEARARRAAKKDAETED